jgi:predicted phage replisome organizer
MAEVQWFKVLTDIFSDDKIKIIQSMPEGDGILVMWFKVLAQAGKTNDGGYVYLKKQIPYNAGMLSTLFGKPQQFVEMALKIFSQFGMIDVDENGYIFVTNWEKHQAIEKLDKIREQTRLRVQKHREEKRLELMACNVTVTDDVTQDNATDIDIEKDINIYSPKSETIVPDEKQIFDHWNEKKIVVHREISRTMESSIRARLEKRTVDEIKAAISNYCEILKDDKYFFSYKWGLNDFMNPKNLDKFLDDNEPKKNFLADKSKSKRPSVISVPIPLEPEPSEEARISNADIIRRQQELRTRTGTTPY